MSTLLTTIDESETIQQTNLQEIKFILTLQFLTFWEN